MSNDKKRLSSRVLDTCLWLCLILGHSSAAFAEIEIGVLANYLVPRKQSDPCSVINIHSLILKTDGTTLYQQGQGWVTLLNKKNSRHDVGVVMPYHVVVNASAVYGECRGLYFPLSEPVIDAEMDLVHMVIDRSEVQRELDLMPALWQITSQEIRDIVYPSTYPQNLHNQKVDPKQLGEALPQALAAMAAFGVATAPQNGQDSLLMSPNGDGIVFGKLSERTASRSGFIHIENFGIRPGLSGGVLFGILDDFLTRSTNSKSGQSQYRIPVELMPKTILGMVTKTKLNGAETVATSLPDLAEFLKTHVIQGLPIKAKGLEVHYHEVSNADGGFELQSYMSLYNGDNAVTVQEVCSAEFKQSADISPLMPPGLKALVEAEKKIPDPKSLQLPIQLNDLTQRQKLDIKFQNDLKNLKNLQKKSGGGEYGEGGDGFGSRKAQFLTSRTPVNATEQSRNFQAISEASSFGLYLKNQSCQQRGLRIGDKNVNTIVINGEMLRLATYEDLRKISLSANKSLKTILDQAWFETKPFFTFNEKWSEPFTFFLKTGQFISSVDENWRPGGKQYFKEKIGPAFKSNSYMTISKDSLLLNTELMGISEGVKTGWLQLSYQQNQWQGRFSLGPHCEIHLSPDRFKAVHPWLVEYADGRNSLKIEMGVQNKLLQVTFQKVGCEGMKDLALGEVEIIPNPQLQIFEKSLRTSMIAMPIDFKAIQKENDRILRQRQGQE